MRIRSIRPEFWSSEDVAALPWDARLVFIGLWSYVDDNGVGRDDDRLIVADLFPLDDDHAEASRKVHGALKLLADGGQIRRYMVAGRRYLHITAFSTHQVINRPSAGRYPGPTSADASEPLDPPELLTEPSEPGEGEKGRRGEGEKKDTAPPARVTAEKPAAKKATRVPEPFDLDDTLKAFAVDLGFQPREALKATEAFVDYWRGRAGQAGTKLDWPATWRNWMRREAERRNLRPAAAGDAPAEKPWEKFA